MVENLAVRQRLIVPGILKTMARKLSLKKFECKLRTVDFSMQGCERAVPVQEQTISDVTGGLCRAGAEDLSASNTVTGSQKGSAPQARGPGRR